MKAVLSLLVVFLTIAGCHADDPTESLPGVVDLTPDNFDSIVNGAKHALVEFYAPWCGHCKRLVPEYQKLGETVTSDPSLSSRIVVAKVDADKHRSLGERFSVRGFPTILYFARGKPVTESESYEQGRTADAMLGFLKGKAESDKSFARIEALDSIVQGFVSADDKSAILKKVEDAVSGLEGDDAVNGKIYIDVITKAIAKGDEYLSKEKARVDRIIMAGGVHPTKLDQISRKSNIISAVLGDE